MNLTEQLQKLKLVQDFSKASGLFIPIDTEDYTDKIFILVNGWEIWWNEEGNVDDLFEGNGETYSCEMYRKIEEDENYILIEFDDHHNNGYALFKKTNECKES